MQPQAEGDVLFGVEVARRRVQAVNGIAERVVDTNGRVGVGEDGGDVPGVRGVVRLCVRVQLKV